MHITIGESASNQFDFWTIAGPAAAILAALAGWLVVERFARARERRADLRSLISILDDSIERIVEQAVDFYSVPGDDKTAQVIANSLKAKLAALSTHLNTIRHCGINLNTDLEMKAFRQAVTGGAFESAIRPVIPTDCLKFRKISMTAEDLSLKVKAEFFREITQARS